MKNYDMTIAPSFEGSHVTITNLTGHPVVCWPVGFTQNGFPSSITMIGNLKDEATILAVAKDYHNNTEFNKAHPDKFKH